MIFKSDSGQSDLNGFLDAGSHVEGELRFDSAFRVDGKINGTVISEGDLVVGERGEIEGELTVGQIFISGTVRGNVLARRRIQIASNGRVYGDLETPSLVIEDGAVFEGRCSMVTEERARAQSQVGPKLVTPVPLPSAES